MNIYTTALIFIIGMLSNTSYNDSVQSINKKIVETGATEIQAKKMRFKNSGGSVIGVLVCIWSIVYACIYLRTWSSAIYLVISALLTPLLYIIIKRILPEVFQRILIISILPIFAFIYLITRLF